MESIEHYEKFIESKIKLLHRVNKKTDEVLESKQITEIERHKRLFTKLDEIEELRTKVIELKYIKDEEESIDAWEKQLDWKLEMVKDPLEKLQQESQIICTEDEASKRHMREEQERIQRDEKAKQELEIEKRKLELRYKYETTHKDEKVELAKVKLPKLVITPFQANHLDWLRLWNEFNAEIEKSALPAVSKFSYLKELLTPKAKVLINGLPFNAEGYERAKVILESAYGKPTEVAKAHVQQIVGLPSITYYNVPKFHEFYKKLLINVQSLQTVGKLYQINGSVLITLDKLQPIRADLVHLDTCWEE